MKITGFWIDEWPVSQSQEIDDDERLCVYNLRVHMPHDTVSTAVAWSKVPPALLRNVNMCVGG